MAAKRVVVPLDEGLGIISFHPSARAEAWSRRAREAAGSIRQRLLADAQELIAQLERDLQAHMEELREGVLGEALRENVDLRERLSAADDALLRLLHGTAGPVHEAPQEEELCGVWRENAELRTRLAAADEALRTVLQVHAPWAAKPEDASGESAAATVVLQQDHVRLCADSSVDSSRGGTQVDDDHGVASRKTSRRQESLSSNGVDTSEAEARSRPAAIVKRLVQSRHFEMMVASIIMLNCVTMGLDCQQRIDQPWGPHVTDTLEVSEHVFTVFYTVECLLRLVAFGCRGFVPTTPDGRENLFDALLVWFSGILITWILPLAWDVTGDPRNSADWRFVKVVRAMRVTRLARVFHRVPFFEEAWMILRGVADSGRTLLWTCIVLTFLTYVFAILGIGLLVEDLQRSRATFPDGSDDAETIDELLLMIAGVDRMMYTLVQLMSLDSAFDIMRKIMIYIPWSWVYFFSYLGFNVFVILNLVTAVIVQNGMAASSNDHDYALMEKEGRKQRELRDLRHLFGMMDADGSGTLCWQEFKESFEDPTISKKWKLLDFQPAECKELFQLLDDGDGEIETDEFFAGLERMKGPAQSKDIYRLQKDVLKLQAALDVFSSAVTTGGLRMVKGVPRRPSCDTARSDDAGLRPSKGS